MIDIESEQLIPFRDAPKHIPGRPHAATCHRWRLVGVRGVKLETIKVGSKRFTSKEAIRRFSEQTTAAADGVAPTPSPSQTRKHRDREVAALKLKHRIKT